MFALHIFTHTKNPLCRCCNISEFVAKFVLSLAISLINCKYPHFTLFCGFHFTRIFWCIKKVIFRAAVKLNRIIIGISKVVKWKMKQTKLKCFCLDSIQLYVFSRPEWNRQNIEIVIYNKHIFIVSMILFKSLT